MAEVTITGVPRAHRNLDTGTPEIPQFPMRAFAITIGDTYSEAVNVYCGVTGDIEVIPAGGDNAQAATAVVFKNFPQGNVLPVRVSQVVTTNTTATNLVALV